MGKKIIALVMALMICICPALGEVIVQDNSEKWNFGFGRQPFAPDPESSEPLYIAGYNNGVEVSDILDLCEARAVWLDCGGDGVLLIGIDCIGLDSRTVGVIRDGLSDIENCASVNVYSTHTHAGADTLGLWGPLGVDGKNDAYMQALIDAAIKAGHEAAEDVRSAEMYFSNTETTRFCRDSRLPEVYDHNLYQLRLAADDGAGLRMIFYGAHAEALRGDNTLLSRDFPGEMCDIITDETGDDCMFVPGAIGGLIMTKEFRNIPQEAVGNMQFTAEMLAKYALLIPENAERRVEPSLQLAREVITVPLDNTAFLMYKYLGILGTKAVKAESATGYGVETEFSVMMLGDIALALVPGEIFPELVYPGKFGDANPEGVNPPKFTEIAAQYGVKQILIAGLANDEIGYIVPPSDFLLNEDAPYLEKTMDHKGENHYEETNSVGPACAGVIADAFEAALSSLFK